MAAGDLRVAEAEPRLGTVGFARIGVAIPALLGGAHALADGSAGWMLGSLTNRLSPGEVGTLLLVYNALGFATQPFFGWLVDRGRWARAAVLVGLGAQLLALILVPIESFVAVAIAGVGSALFHVGAGSIALNATPGRATGVGLFAAPGVLGLGIGGACAIAGLEIGLVLAVLLLCLLATLGLTLPSAQFIRDLPHSESKSSQHAVFEAHDLLMIGLLAAIALRSLVWTSFTWIVEGQSQSLLLLSAAAAAGKLLGGPMADRFGWRRWSVGALIGAATLAVVGSNHPALMCLSAALLQSATPATVAALLTWLPGRPALASGLAFGVAIAFGGAPFAFGFGMPLLATPVTVAAIALTVLCTFLLVPRTRSQPLIKLPHPAIIHDRSRT